MRMPLLLAPLCAAAVLPSIALAEQRSDCRIARLDIRVKIPDADPRARILTVLYRNARSEQLTNVECPDQALPTWGSSSSLRCLEPRCLKVRFDTFEPGEIVEAATYQVMWLPRTNGEWTYRVIRRRVVLR